MEGGRILYFYLKEGEKWKKHRWNQGKMPVKDIGVGEEGMLGCCGVPEFYRKNSVWKEDRLRDAMGRMLKEQGAEEFYLQPRLARLAGVDEKMPPEMLLKKVLSQSPCMEYLVYIGGSGEKRGAWEEEEFREERRLLFYLLSPYLARINHFTLVTGMPEGYEEFTDYIYDEYGIPTAAVAKMDRPYGKDGRTVILDRSRGREPALQAIPYRASYVDFWCEDGKRERIEKEREDIRYISVVKFLDTLVKNGYNTIVNSRRQECREGIGPHIRE